MRIKNQIERKLDTLKFSKNYLFVLLVILSFFLTSCSSSQGGVIRTDIHQGTEGLNLAFVKTMPPTDITDGTTFQIGIELRNKGTEKIEEGYLTLINYYPEEMFLKDESKTKNFDLEGKSIYNIDGGFDLVTYTIENKGIPVKQKLDSNFLFKVLACYKYKTLASVNVCIKPKASGFLPAKDICNVEDVSISNGQGGPLAVTKVEQSILPKTDDQTGKIIYSAVYKILLENKGKGMLIDPNYYKKECMQESYRKEGAINTLQDSNMQVTLSNTPLVCSPVSQMPNSEAFYLVCNAQLGELKEGYSTPLIINVEYGYITQEIETTVFVKKMTQNMICEREKCLDKKTGVCELYGGENYQASPSCNIDQVCCFESIDRCGRDFGNQGFTCKQKEGCNPNFILEGYCPGSSGDVCCKSK